jgi:general secretion pathway protein G
MKKTQRKEIPMIERIREARKSEGGFTLIELLMVIVILGILAGVVVFAVSGIQDKGKAAACQSDVKTVTVAAETYYAQNGSYAASVAALETAGLIHSTPTDVTYSVTAATATAPAKVTVAGNGTGNCAA